MTTYRQQALAYAALLRPGHAAPDAGSILFGNVYGWFERAQRGVYQLTADGEAALRRWPDASVKRRRLQNRDRGQHHQLEIVVVGDDLPMPDNPFSQSC